MYIKLYCAFHKHANSKVQKPPSQLRFSLPSIIFTITSNEPGNKETHKTDRNPTITDHKSWPFELVKVNFCFLRGPPRWLTAAKNEKRQLAFDEGSIVTGSHMTSCNKSSFSRQEKEPEERDCRIIKFLRRSRYVQQVFSLADMTVLNVQWHSCHFTSFWLFVAVVVVVVFTNKNVALICSINFWTEHKGLRTVKEPPA